jgi:hypothetical protein
MISLFLKRFNYRKKYKINIDINFSITVSLTNTNVCSYDYILIATKMCQFAKNFNLIVKITYNSIKCLTTSYTVKNVKFLTLESLKNTHFVIKSKNF